MEDDELWVPTWLGADVALAARGWIIPDHARHRGVKRGFTRVVFAVNSLMGRQAPSAVGGEPESVSPSGSDRVVRGDELELRLDILERAVEALAQEVRRDER